MGKAKLHDNSDENKRVSPKCGSKTIDLGKKCNRRELMLTPAEGQEVCCSTPFLSLSLCRLLRPPIPRLPSPPKRGVFRKLNTSDFFDRKCRTFASKVPMFCPKKSDVFIFRNGTFQPCRHRPSPPKAVDKGGSRRKNGSRKDFSAGLRKNKNTGEGRKTCAFCKFFLGNSAKTP